MRVIVAAIHGILTRQTDASWPDRFDSWMYARDPHVHVIKKEYVAGPFPRFNCWVKDPLIARGLAAEIGLFVTPKNGDSQELVPPVWFVAHSNGAVIALLAANRLIARGHRVGGMVLTGAACEADTERNQVCEWIGHGKLGRAIAYSSADDQVLRWGRLMWPYGSLGRTGWTWRGKPCQGDLIFTRWFQGGHSAYFDGASRTGQPQIEKTFKQIYQDIQSTQRNPYA